MMKNRLRIIVSSILILILLLDCKSGGNESYKKEELLAKNASLEFYKALTDSKEDSSKTELDSKIKVSYKIKSKDLETKKECIKCNTQLLKEVEENLNNISYQTIYDFLCSFGKACSNNAEYSERSNEILYKVISNHPDAFIDILSKNPHIVSEYIYEELANPLLDYDYDRIYSAVDKAPGDNQIKKRILGSLKKAKE